MGLLDTYRINKAVTVLLGSQDAASAETMQAVATLKRLGPAAIPKLIEALGRVHNAQAVVPLLATMVQNTTLPLFGNGLASSNARIIAGVSEALLQATSYDPNRLLDFFTDPRIPKATLGKLLAARKDALQPEPLLRCLDTVRAEERPLLLSLVRHAATVATVPALIRRTTNADDKVRLAIVHTLARFRTEEVRDTLTGLLADPSAAIRTAALEGLMGLQLPLSLAPICQLLRDPEKAVRRQVSLLLTQLKDTQAVPYLFDVLQDSSAEIRQGAIELLHVLGDSHSVRSAVMARTDTAAVHETLRRLLEAPQTRIRQMAFEGLTGLGVPLDVETLCRLLWDSDRGMRQQAVLLLSQLNTEQTLPVLLETLQNEAADVRQSAVTILNTIADTDLLTALLQGLREKEWWATVRVTDALGRHGGAKIVDAVLRLSLDEDAFLRRIALEVLKLSQDPQIVTFLVEALEQDEARILARAAEAVTVLEEKRAVPMLLQRAETGPPELCLVALRTLTALGDPRAIPLFLTHLQQGPAEIQQVVLQALATITDAAHSEAVLQAVMTVRSTNDTALKALANNTASALIRRFGERAVGRSMVIDASLCRPAAPSPPQSLLYEGPNTESGTQPTSDTPTGRSASQADSPTQGANPDGGIDATTLEPGMMLGERYRVVRRVGQGGFGTVVLVEDTMIREHLILKFLHMQMATDRRMIKRFIRELRYARRVTHENVIRIHDFLRVDKSYAISMEYFASHSLSAELPKNSPMPLLRALRILWHICRGMHAAHQAKIIHRDLKPPNVLINDAGVVKIVDFGLAAAASDTATRLTRTGALLGTPLYMAPEQVQNRELDARADIYSLGVMMYEMCTGRAPYGGSNPMSILYQHLEGKAPPPRTVNPTISPELEAVISKAMAVDPGQRFQSMEALGKSLVPLIKQATR
ncbi:MAG: HEAT repeat domain-containing protein [Candidatus Tectimicrobiota bacterium]